LCELVLVLALLMCAFGLAHRHQGVCQTGSSPTRRWPGAVLPLQFKLKRLTYARARNHETKGPSSGNSYQIMGLARAHPDTTTGARPSWPQRLPDIAQGCGPGRPRPCQAPILRWYYQNAAVRRCGFPLARTSSPLLPHRVAQAAVSGRFGVN